MKSILKIGNAGGFWGDRSDAASELLTQQPDIDYITLDYLSEVSLSIMASQQKKEPSLGYARDFVEVVRSLIPLWKAGSKVKVIANAGGLNPRGCAMAIAELLRQSGCFHLKVGIVTGDDVLKVLKSDSSNSDYNNMDTHELLSSVINKLSTANAYLGAFTIAESLTRGADIVITGRIADPSLTVAPCIAHFGWRPDDFNKIAGATVAGHLIECGTQVTGGISAHWLDVPDLDRIGFPFVEIDQNGDFIITKPSGSGGAVTTEIVKEQLLYEIGDPEKYISPDAVVSFTSLNLNAIAPNRVRVSGAIGKAPPFKYKVSATYEDGYKAEGSLVIFGRDCGEKARRTGEMILKRMEKAGFDPKKKIIECIGCGEIVPGVRSFEGDANPKSEGHGRCLECLLRVCIADERKEILEYFSKQIAPMVTSGSPGTTGYISGRPLIRQVFGYWPCLIQRDLVKPVIEIMEVKP